MHTYKDLFYAKDKDQESFRRSKKKGRIVMTITKKHLKELADIVYAATQKAETCTAPGDQDLEAVAREIKSFAQRHAPNFSESHWNDHMHKRRMAEENKPEPNKQYRLVGGTGEKSIARGNTWAESEIK